MTVFVEVMTSVIEYKHYLDRNVCFKGNQSVIYNIGLFAPDRARSGASVFSKSALANLDDYFNFSRILTLAPFGI